MKKYFITESYSDEPSYLTLEAATARAQVRTQSNKQAYGVFELVQVVKYPLPNYEVVAVTA